MQSSVSECASLFFPSLSAPESRGSQNNSCLLFSFGFIFFFYINISFHADNAEFPLGGRCPVQVSL